MENIVIAVIATVYMDKSLTYIVIWVVMVMEDNSVVHTTRTQYTSSNQPVWLCEMQKAWSFVFSCSTNDHTTFTDWKLNINGWTMTALIFIRKVNCIARHALRLNAIQSLINTVIWIWLNKWYLYYSFWQVVRRTDLQLAIRSSLIHFACIGVAPPLLLKPQAFGANSRGGLT